LMNMGDFRKKTRVLPENDKPISTYMVFLLEKTRKLTLS
jgi:hypothetical protein